MVVSITAVALARAAIPRPGSAPGDRRLGNGLMLWSSLAAAVVAWELFALARQPEWHRPSPSAPTLSTLLDPVLEHGPGRWVGWLLWLAVGWRLLR